MSQNTGHTRICPTRLDGATALFNHKVTVPQCQDRQRGRYHKCYTCSYNNEYLAQVAKTRSASEKLAERVGRKASVQAPETQVAVEALGPVLGPPKPEPRREPKPADIASASGDMPLESLPAPA